MKMIMVNGKVLTCSHGNPADKTLTSGQNSRLGQLETDLAWTGKLKSDPGQVMAQQGTIARESKFLPDPDSVYYMISQKDERQNEKREECKGISIPSIAGASLPLAERTQ